MHVQGYLWCWWCMASRACLALFSKKFKPNVESKSGVLVAGVICVWGRCGEFPGKPWGPWRFSEVMLDGVRS